MKRNDILPMVHRFQRLKCTTKVAPFTVYNHLNFILQVLSIILVNNSQENADKYIHADNDENNEEYAVPVVQVVCRNHDIRIVGSCRQDVKGEENIKIIIEVSSAIKCVQIFFCQTASNQAKRKAIS